MSRRGKLKSVFTIKQPDEECPCAYCAYPLYVGDLAVEAQTGDIVCGRECANKIGGGK